MEPRLIRVELLIHTLSHLDAADLMSVALINKEFYALVTSPDAWRAAFARFFPGPVVLSEPPMDSSIMKMESTTFVRIEESSAESPKFQHGGKSTSRGRISCVLWSEGGQRSTWSSQDQAPLAKLSKALLPPCS